VVERFSVWRPAVTLLLLAVASTAAPKLSPFTAVEFDGETPLVRFEGKWYRLVQLDSIEAGKIVAFCKERYRGKWQRRFAEDLVEVLEAMGKQPGRTIALRLTDKQTGKERRVSEAPMTKENRQAVWEARHTARFDAAAAAADMLFLGTFLESHHSYRLRFPKSLDRFDWEAGRTVSKDEFAIDIARRLALFGDGHARVRGRWAWLPKGYAPFVARVAGKRYAALDAAGRALISKRYPYLAAIDGVPIEKWIAATGATVAHGSEAYRRWRGAEELTFLAFLRRELELPAKGKVELKLQSEDGRRTKVVKLPVVQTIGRPAAIVRPESGKLEGNLGYLRIADMTGRRAEIDRILEQVNALQRTRGFVIDVRGNGGGTRDVLRTLLPRFLEERRVVNAAVYRLPPGEAENDDGHLARRFLYPRTWSGWSDAQRATLIRFNRKFAPEWEPSMEHFTSWHYMIVDPAAKPDRYRGRVVILMDGGCFSATDIFLGAFRGLDHVTLMGTSSGGGSGRSMRFTLPKSGVRMRVSTMASFQPNGKLYDGNGIAPDIVVERTAADCIGKTDTQLDAAIEYLATVK